MPGTLGWLLVLGLSVVGASGGVVFTNLYSFTGYSDGSVPWAPLMQGTDGNLYGTANFGGAAYSIFGYGAIFEITNGTFNPLYQFQNNGDGDGPDLSGLTEGPDGWFYGTTASGGDYAAGVIFVMTPDGFLFPIYSFASAGNDGLQPASGLVLGADGNFYGTTYAGGQYSFGTIFRMTLDWEYTNLFSFNATNGAAPYGALMCAQDGSLYGTTFAGGPAYHGLDGNGNPTGYGTIFKFTTNGAFTSLVSFASNNGAQPVAGLVQGRDGVIYGTTQVGGASGYGTVFKLTTNGNFGLLYSFSGSGAGGYPTGRLVQGLDGNLYGTTADIQFINGGGSAVAIGNGTIFRITPAGAFTTLYAFPGRPGGVEPIAGLLHANDGSFYGTCMGGPNGFGMLFQVIIPSVPPAPMLQSPRKLSGGFAFSWSAVAGQVYQAQYKADLRATIWSNLGPIITATNGLMSTSDLSATDSKRFYRVVLVQ